MALAHYALPHVGGDEIEHLLAVDSGDFRLIIGCLGEEVALFKRAVAFVGDEGPCSAAGVTDVGVADQRLFHTVAVEILLRKHLHFAEVVVSEDVVDGADDHLLAVDHSYELRVGVIARNLILNCGSVGHCHRRRLRLLRGFGVLVMTVKRHAAYCSPYG